MLSALLEMAALPVAILAALVAMLPALATIACELAAVALYTTSMTWPAFSHSAEQSNRNSSICSRSQFLVGSIVGMSLGSELGGEVVSGAFSYRSLAQLPPVPASQLEAVPNGKVKESVLDTPLVARLDGDVCSSWTAVERAGSSILVTAHVAIAIAIHRQQT